MAVLQGTLKVQPCERDQSVNVSVRECVMEDGWMSGTRGGGGEGVHTSCDPQHSHDADDGGVDGQRSLLNLLQSDAHDGQQHDDQIQLVPPTQKHALISSLTPVS